MILSWPTGKQYVWAVLGFVGLEVVSWLAYTGPRSEQIVAAAAVITAVVLAGKRLTWLAYATVAELVVGSKGYLLFLTIGQTRISLRILLFTIFIGATLPRLVKHWSALRSSVLSNSFLWFAGWLAAAAFIGIARHNGLGDVYRDANAWLFLALLPAWWLTIRGDPVWRQRLILLLIAGATVTGVKSLLTLYAFGHDLPNIQQIYRWIRNTGVGEVTYINANIYRVFFQSQIYALLAFGVTLVGWIAGRARPWFIIPMALSALAVYISLSRSFWVGLAVGLAVIIAGLIYRRQWKSAARLWIIVPVAAFSWAVTVWALTVPSSGVAGGANIVVARLNGGGTVDASAARRNQIRPLFTAIGRHPVWGSGFGTTVSFYSADPRIRGWRTTAAFELGYLDLWLKIGLLGIVLYLIWLWGLWRRLRRSPWSLIFMSGGLALIAVHATSPYLNHPLGLGWLMLIALYAHDPG
ncbi:MAG: O-antigen ligase family protein [Patescibacteria group bacterium]